MLRIKSDVTDYIFRCKSLTMPALLRNRYFLFFITLYTGVCALVFSYMLYFYVGSDLHAHIQILLSFVEVGSIPTPPGYYTLVYLLHFVMPYNEGYALAAVVVLAAAGFFKYGISYKYLNTYCPGLAGSRIGIFTWALMFFAPLTLFGLEGELWYLGKFTPLIWHNSTSLLSFPFCILLFYYSIQYLETRDNGLLIRIFIVATIIVLIKPSFVFAFLPAFPLSILIIDKKWSADVSKTLALGIPLVAIVILEKILIYNVNPIDSHLETGIIDGIGIRPFYLWLYHSESLLWDVVSSFLFPFFFIVFYFKKLIMDPHAVFAGLLIVVAHLIFFTLVETGPRMTDGNFFWQVILTLFMGYLVLTKHLLNLYFGAVGDVRNERRLSYKTILLLVLFFFHVIGGLAYTIRIFTTHAIS